MYLRMRPIKAFIYAIVCVYMGININRYMTPADFTPTPIVIESDKSAVEEYNRALEWHNNNYRKLLRTVRQRNNEIYRLQHQIEKNNQYLNQTYYEWMEKLNSWNVRSITVS